MKLYTIFVVAFVVSIIAVAFFLVPYFQVIFSLFKNVQHVGHENPDWVFENIFTPQIIGSWIITMIASLTYIVTGIIMVMKNPNMGDTDRLLWVLGFIFAGFITAIVFMILQKSKNLTATKLSPENFHTQQPKG